MTRRTWIFVVLGLVFTAPCHAANPLAQAEAMIEVDRFDAALAALKTAEIASDESARRLDMALGRIYLGVGKPDRALDFFEKASMEGADDGPALAAMAEAELALGHPKKALEQAQKAVKSDGGGLEAQVALALTGTPAGRHDLSDGVTARLGSSMPDSEEVALARARIAAAANRSQALALLRDFVGGHPFAARAEDQFGKLLWQSGSHDLALEHRLHAASQLAAQGDTARAEAIRGWITAAEVMPQPAAPPPPATAVASAQPSASVLPPGEGQPQKPEFRELFPFRPKFGGSGIVLEGGRRVLTNRHVAQDGTKFAARTGLGHVRRLRVIGVDTAADLALLEADTPFPGEVGFPLARLATAKAGRRITVLGFPFTDALGEDAPSLTEGVISKETGLGDDQAEFQMTARIEPGSSGGPIFDHYGDLIGLSVASLNTAGLEKARHTVLQSVSFGVAPTAIARFLKLPPPAPPAGGAEINPEAFYQEILPCVVMIVGE